MSLDVGYYNKFPTVLKNALISGKISFPTSLQREYSDLEVYRGVRYSKTKTIIDTSDFASNIERKLKNPMVVADENNISSYSCSCYMKIEAMHIYAKFPRKNSAIAKGIIKKEFGPIDIIMIHHILIYTYLRTLIHQ